MDVFENFKYMIRPTGINGNASKELVELASKQMNYMQQVNKKLTLDLHGTAIRRPLHVRLSSEHALHIKGIGVGRSQEHRNP